MNDIFDNMLAAHRRTTDSDNRNAMYEVTQQIALAGLYRGGFFEKAAFYGGTCLRIVHGLNRYSGDMGFSLLQKDNDFKIENYFDAIVTEFKALGREVVITKKDKKNFGKGESAFLKDTTEVYDLTFQTEKSIKVKIEVDTAPPLDFQTEQKLILQPFSFMVRCFALPDLFAGKLHALVFRNWKNRVKGRDWYDFEWYIRHGIPLDYRHLRERIREFNGVDMSVEQFLMLLRERLLTVNLDQVKTDVRPFILDATAIDIWSNDYFVQLADHLRIL